MKKSSYIYSDIANKLSQAIHDGIFNEGQRMPSLRQICDRYGISMATAQRAYSVLENDNYIVTQPRSGFFVRANFVRDNLVRNNKAKQVQQPVVKKMVEEPYGSQFCSESKRLTQALQQRGLYHFGNLASPCPSLIPAKNLARHYGKVARANPSIVSQYSGFVGGYDMRVAVAKKMMDVDCNVNPDDIIMTNGCQAALVLALSAVANKGDVIAIESPTYMGITHLLDALELQSIELPAHPERGIELNDLETLLRNNKIRAFVSIPTCQNPTGSIMSTENKRQMVGMLANANIPLIEDDAMGDLVYKKPRPFAAKSFDTSGNVLYCSSFSKILGPGHRMGWLVPGRFLDHAQFINSVTSLAPAIITERALASFLQTDNYVRTVYNATAEYQRRMKFLRKWVVEYFPGGTRMTDPKGGFLLWIELPGNIDAIQLTRLAMKQKIAVGLGVLYSRRQFFTNHIRLSCADADLRKMENAVATLGSLAKKMLPTKYLAVTN